jgi:hypothetical protein
MSTKVYLVGPIESLKTNRWEAMTNNWEAAIKLMAEKNPKWVHKVVTVEPPRSKRGQR